MLQPPVAQRLELVLADARRLGFLGPGPVADQVARSLAFATTAGAPPDGLAVDLGTGGGLPGLVLALAWPDSHWLLIDSNHRRASWLDGATGGLGIATRVEVACERAELLGRGARRQTADLVTARGFGPPGPTAECAAPLLRLRGRLLVADPPQGQVDRWPTTGLDRLGLELDSTAVVTTPAGPISITCIVATSDCGPLYPRRVGVPFKRPLF